MGILLIASLWSSVDLHYCQGNLKTFSLNGKAKNCHEMAKGMASCKHHKTAISDDSCSEESGNCCHHETFLIDDDILQVFSQIDFIEQAQFTKALFPIGSSLFSLEGIVHFITEYLNYKPPLIQANIVILFGSFLL